MGVARLASGRLSLVLGRGGGRGAGGRGWGARTKSPVLPRLFWEHSASEVRAGELSQAASLTTTSLVILGALSPHCSGDGPLSAQMPGKCAVAPWGSRPRSDALMRKEGVHTGEPGESVLLPVTSAFKSIEGSRPKKAVLQTHPGQGLTPGPSCAGPWAAPAYLAVCRWGAHATSLCYRAVMTVLTRDLGGGIRGGEKHSPALGVLATKGVAGGRREGLIPGDLGPVRRLGRPSGPGEESGISEGLGGGIGG